MQQQPDCQTNSAPLTVSKTPRSHPWPAAGEQNSSTIPELQKVRSSSRRAMVEQSFFDYEGTILLRTMQTSFLRLKKLYRQQQ